MILLRDGHRVDDLDPVQPIRASHGAFTTAGCSGGRPLLWPAHAARLAGTVRVLGAPRGLWLPSESEVAGLLADRGLQREAVVRVVARRLGQGEGWSVEVSAEALAAGGPGQPPVRLSVQVWDAAPPLAGHKTLARLAWDLARAAARDRGADDVLLTDRADRVLETSVANLMAVVGGSLVTPPAPRRCLPGVLRGWLLQAVGRCGLVPVERDLALSELAAADELWVTNAVQGARPVAAVDDRRWDRWPVLGRLVALGVPAPGWPPPQG